MLKIWYSDEAFARYVVSHVPHLQAADTRGELQLASLPESDAANRRGFHKVPTHLKQILYLDSPDLVIEEDNEPFLSIEVSEEAGTGHNAFQRFGRLVAAVERKVPALYIYPEAVWVSRATGGRWDRINPSVFLSLERVMRIYNIPALLFYFPTEHRARRPDAPVRGAAEKGLLKETTPPFAGKPEATGAEMQTLFATVDLIVKRGARAAGDLLTERSVQERRDWMQAEWAHKGGPGRTWAPETSTLDVPSEAIADYIQRTLGTRYRAAGFFADRSQTLLYCVNSRKVRSDPYTGAFAALDYLRCRTGESFEDRDRNLVFAWGDVGYDGNHLTISGEAGNSVAAYTEPIRQLYGDANRAVLAKPYGQLRAEEMPRYFMQVRFGTAFTKSKVTRMLAYFADAILFHDGVLWREG